MAKFYLIYNPYTVNANLFVNIEKRWMPVNEESGLLRIANSRLQSWLDLSETNDNRSYFDELCAASGEQRLEVIFSGTSEDLSDLTRAAEIYVAKHPQVQITVAGDVETKNNSSSQKFQQLKNILSEARDNKFRVLLPEKFWRYMNEEIFNRDKQPVRFMASNVCKKESMFALGAWQMFCVKFSFDEIRSENVRQWLREFANCLVQIENRNLERERFLFLFCCENTFVADATSSRNAVLKLLMEYGLSDLRFALLTAAEIGSTRSEERDNDRLRAALEVVSFYRQRCAEQVMLKKMHDMLKEILTQEGFRMSGHGNFRRVEDILQEASRGRATDAEIKAANEWLAKLFNKLNHFLDIGTRSLV